MSSPREYPPRKRLRGSQKTPPESPSLLFSSPVAQRRSSSDSDWRGTVQQFDEPLNIGYAEEEVQYSEEVVPPPGDISHVSHRSSADLSEVRDEESSVPGSGTSSGTRSGTSGARSGTSFPSSGTSGTRSGTSGARSGTSFPSSGTSGTRSGTSGARNGTSFPSSGTSGTRSGTSGARSGTSFPSSGTSGTRSGTSGARSGTSFPSSGTSGTRSGTLSTGSPREYPPRKRLKGNEQSPPSGTLSDTPGTRSGTPNTLIGTPGTLSGTTGTLIGTPGTRSGTPGSRRGTPGTGSGTSSTSSLPQEVVDYYDSIQNKLVGLDTEDLVTLYSEGNEGYLFVESLGHGAFGDVWKGVKAEGRNTRHREEIAIKLIRTDTPQMQWGYEREMKAVQKLMDYPHNNVIYFMEYFDDRSFETHYIISELAPIGDLFNGLQQLDTNSQLVWVPLQPQYCRHLIKGISHGLQHLFKHGISHGDIKLENILLYWVESTHPPTQQSVQDLTLSRFMQMVPKLCDFSNAKMSTPGAPIMAGSPHCSPYTAAPESNGATRYDMKVADVYSVGACLLAMLLACHPFAPPDPNIPSDEYIIRTTQLKRDRNLINQLTKSFDYRLKQVLIRLLEPEPQNRITINEFLADEWFTHRIESHEREEPWRRTQWRGRPQQLWSGSSY